MTEGPTNHLAGTRSVPKEPRRSLR